MATRDMSEVRIVAPIAAACGALRLPGSKSISNRVLLLAALARGVSRLTGVLDADDTRVMLLALRQLGVDVKTEGDATVVIGCGGRFPVRQADLFLGNAGTAMRPLAAVLAFSGGTYRLDGMARMRERPIGDLVASLRQLGAKVAYEGEEGFPPIRIQPAMPLVGDIHRVVIKGDVSSQFVTGLLIASPAIAPVNGVLRVAVEGALISEPYVALTVALMRQFGIDVVREADAWRVPHGNFLAPTTLAVEGDASSASYFLALGVLAGGPVRVEGIGRDSVQGDVVFVDLVERMGGLVTRGSDWIESARGQRRLVGIEADCKAIPDAAMTLCMLALFAEGSTRLTNIGSWRVKETDRIAAMACELRKLGANVDEGPDWIRIDPPARLGEATIDTYDDHRIAMCFALAACGGIKVHVRDPRCVEKTFPTYFNELDRLTRQPVRVEHVR